MHIGVYHALYTVHILVFHALSTVHIFAYYALFRVQIQAQKGILFVFSLHMSVFFRTFAAILEDNRTDIRKRYGQ